MTIQQLGKVNQYDILQFLETLAFAPFKSRRTHDYTCHQFGVDYVFESTDAGSKGYMTGQGNGVKQGDYLLLKNGEVTERYQVEGADYYSSPSNMWVASLIKVR